MSDYRVGRGRPPREWQFKPGQSGNPGGRPKKRRETDLLRLLEEPVSVTQNGRTRSLQPAEIALRRIAKRAIKDGDLRSILYLIRLFQQHGVFAPSDADQEGGVLRLPSDMPWEMALDLTRRFDAPPWSKKQKAVGREHYLATRSEDERLVDEAMEYAEL